MLLDCFTFFRELDILEGRLEYLYDLVDYFVISEADITHSGNKKELNFLKNINRYKPYLDKIIYQPISIDTEQFKDSENIDVTNSDHLPWKIENAQRSHLDNTLKLFDDDTIVMISDLDEIPFRNILTNNLDLLKTYKSFSLSQRLFYYNFNQFIHFPWYGTVICLNSEAKAHGVQWLRNMRNHLPRLFDGGYHLSYWGTAEDIKIKIENFAHQELNNENYTGIEKIKNRIKNGLDPYDRSEMIKTNLNDLDQDLYKIFSKYAKTNKKTYIQIGAGAGDRDPRANFRDGFTEYVKGLDRNQIEKIILVEPNPLNIDGLRETWKDYPEAEILNFGISSESNNNPVLKFYYTEEDAPHYHVLSVDKSHVMKHYPNSVIKEMELNCMNFSKFLDRYVGVNDVDMLALDIEGLEANLILETDWTRFKVNQISFENIHLDDKIYDVAKKLNQCGYLDAGLGLDHNGYDSLYRKK